MRDSKKKSIAAKKAQMRGRPGGKQASKLALATGAALLAGGLLLSGQAVAKEFYHSKDSYPQIYNNGYDENEWGQRRDWRDDSQNNGNTYNRVVYGYPSSNNVAVREQGEPDLVVTQSFRGPDRTVIYDYMVNSYGIECPDGLVQFNNRCVHPQKVRTHYVVGRPLPRNVSWQPLPEPLAMQVQAAPTGYRYVTVDGDVLLVSEENNQVIDAVTLRSSRY